MKSLCVFGVGDFAGSSAWKGLTIPSLCTISLACFNILTFCSVSSCRPLSNKIGFTRFGVATQKLFSFRVCQFSLLTGSTGPWTSTTAGHFRCPVPVPLPLIFPRYWNREFPRNLDRKYRATGSTGDRGGTSALYFR